MSTKYDDEKLSLKIANVFQTYEQKRFLKEALKEIGIHENTWRRWIRMLSPERKKETLVVYKELREAHKQFGKRIKMLARFRWTNRHKKEARKYNKEYYAKNKKKIDKKHQEYYWKDHEKTLERERKKYRRLKEKHKNV